MGTDVHLSLHITSKETRDADVNPETRWAKKGSRECIVGLYWLKKYFLNEWVKSYQFLPTFRKYIFIISFTFDYSFCNWDLGVVWIALFCQEPINGLMWYRKYISLISVPWISSDAFIATESHKKIFFFDFYLSKFLLCSAVRIAILIVVTLVCTPSISISSF